MKARTSILITTSRLSRPQFLASSEPPSKQRSGSDDEILSGKVNPGVEIFLGPSPDSRAGKTLSKGRRLWSLCWAMSALPETFNFFLTTGEIKPLSNQLIAFSLLQSKIHKSLLTVSNLNDCACNDYLYLLILAGEGTIFQQKFSEKKVNWYAERSASGLDEVWSINDSLCDFLLSENF